MTENVKSFWDSWLGVFIEAGWGLWLSFPFAIYAIYTNKNPFAWVGLSILAIWLFWIFYTVHQDDVDLQRREIEKKERNSLIHWGLQKR